jgi:hypothetical protein
MAHPLRWCRRGMTSQRSSVVPLSPAARAARARLAAHRRWHPGDDLDELAERCQREIDASRDDEVDDAISVIVARAPKLTPEQGARLRRVVNV